VFLPVSPRCARVKVQVARLELDNQLATTALPVLLGAVEEAPSVKYTREYALQLDVAMASPEAQGQDADEQAYPHIILDVRTPLPLPLSIAVSLLLASRIPSAASLLAYHPSGAQGA